MPSWIVPSDSHGVGDTGHTTDHNHVADDLTLINSALPVVSGGLTGAVQAVRLVGATTSGAPVSGTFAVGDFLIDQTGKVWVCTVAGSPGTWVNAGGSGGSGVSSFNGRTGAVTPGNADYLAVASGGLTGTTAAARFVGGTASGAPASGTFAVGDFAVDRTGTIWLCVTAGSPGTWTALLNTSAAQTVSGLMTFTGAGSGTTGSIVTDVITVFPNSGIGSGSASMFLNNGAGQIWEFFCSGGGLFGVYDKTAGGAAMSIAPSTQLATFNGTVDIATAGKGLQVAEGSNAKQGTAVLVAGSKVVSNTSVTANSRIFLTSQADGGTPGWLRVSARTAGTSFTITSSSATDTSTVAYEIFEPG